MKKIIIALLLVALISAGAFAQLMLGVSGALHMDTQLSASDIKARFDNGEGIFYGGFVEIAGRHFGLGVTGNVSYYKGDIDNSFTYQGSTHTYPITNAKLIDYDLTGYISYHIFGARAILDPFGEFGGGVLATGFDSKSDQDMVPWDSPFLAASYYWYAALGLGLNLGPFGIFGKFAFNSPIARSFQANFKDTYGNGSPTGLTGSTDLGPYGYDWFLFPNGYMPKFRFTAGVKLIL